MALFRRREDTRSPEPRTERSRAEDRFARHLEVALRGQPLSIRGPVVLRDTQVLMIPPGQTVGTLQHHAQIRVDFELAETRTVVVVAGLVLTTRSYGRDRRRAPAPLADRRPHQTIVTVLHLDPADVPDVLLLRAALKPAVPL